MEALRPNSKTVEKNPYVSEKDLQEYQSLGKQMEGITARDVGRTIAEFTPVVGDALLAKDAAQSFSEGDIKGGLIDTAALGIGMIPVVGDVAAKAIKKLKEIRKADVARAEKLIDDSKELENWQKENKLPETQRQTNPELSRQAALDLREGSITSKEARKIIKEAIPDTKLYTAETMPNMPTVTEIVGSIGKKAKKYGILGVKGFNLKNGQKISSRLDINAYDNYDTWVVSIHDGIKDAGSVLGYGQAIRLTGGIKFKSNVGLDAVDIARGRRFVKETGKDAVDKKTGEIAKQNKSTIARIFGEYADEDPYELQEKARKILADADPEWTQVGMNPYRGSAFYDKATGNPVFDAEEVIQVGPLVLAKNVKTPTISDIKQMSMRTKDGKIRIFNEGGAVMQDQMKMAFMDEGGLKDEGGQVEPTSGNEVPSGSLKEEVKDDVPTMLSEGEFVFPADVVRYIGLEKLMMMRQEAKMGLKRMEAMGQMGNSDEATMPDDLPFGMSDLVVISGGKDEPKEMAEGGVLTGQQGLFADPRFANQMQSNVPTYTASDADKVKSDVSQGLSPQANVRIYVDKDGNKVNVPFYGDTPQMDLTGLTPLKISEDLQEKAKEEQKELVDPRDEVRKDDSEPYLTRGYKPEPDAGIGKQFSKYSAEDFGEAAKSFEGPLAEAAKLTPLSFLGGLSLDAGKEVAAKMLAEKGPSGDNSLTDFEILSLKRYNDVERPENFITNVINKIKGIGEEDKPADDSGQIIIYTDKSGKKVEGTYDELLKNYLGEYTQSKEIGPSQSREDQDHSVAVSGFSNTGHALTKYGNIMYRPAGTGSPDMDFIHFDIKGVGRKFYRIGELKKALGKNNLTANDLLNIDPNMLRETIEGKGILGETKRSVSYGDTKVKAGTLTEDEASIATKKAMKKQEEVQAMKAQGQPIPTTPKFKKADKDSKTKKLKYGDKTYDAPLYVDTFKEKKKKEKDSTGFVGGADLSADPRVTKGYRGGRAKGGLASKKK